MDPISIALSLAQFAPMLLRFLGVGEKNVAVAENVINVAKSVTGAATGPEALEMLKANKEMQLRFQAAVMENDAALEKLYLSDRSDARARDVVYVKAGQHNIRGNVLAYIAIFAMVGLIAMLFFKGDEMPASVKDLLLVLAGSLVTIVKDVYSFEFGTTRSSKEKDATIANLVER